VQDAFLNCSATSLRMARRKISALAVRVAHNQGAESPDELPPAVWRTSGR